MPKTDPNKPLCTRCKTRNGQANFKGLCNKCYREVRDTRIPNIPKQFVELAAQLKTGDPKDKDYWKTLAYQLQPTIVAMADGTLKASAAQAAIIKEILSRAHGKVTKSQEDERGPVGVVVLPTLDRGISAHVCPKCAEYHTTHG